MIAIHAFALAVLAAAPTQELRASCLFSDPLFSLAEVPSSALPSLLDHHAHCHGWKVGREHAIGPSFLAPARCPDHVLDALRVQTEEPGAERAPAREAVIVALGRSGRVEEALHIARVALSRAAGRMPPGLCEESMRMARAGALAAAAAGRHDEALEFVRIWPPYYECLSIDGGLGERDELRLRVLADAGRLIDEPPSGGGPGRSAKFLAVHWLVAATRDLEPEFVRERAARLAAIHFPGAFEGLPDAVLAVRTAPERPSVREAAHLALWAPEVLRSRVVRWDATTRREFSVAVAERTGSWELDVLGMFFAEFGVPEFEPFFGRLVLPEMARYEYARGRRSWAVWSGEETPHRTWLR